MASTAVSPPVTLEEFRAELNAETSKSAADDELMRTLLAATEMVESAVGAMSPRSVTDRTGTATEQLYPWADRGAYGATYGAGQFGAALLLPQSPVVSVESITHIRTGNTYDPAGFEIDADTGILSSVLSWLPFGPYTVAYTVGRDPVPDMLMKAVLITGEHLWERQRSGVTRPGMLGETRVQKATPRGFALPNAALELINPHRRMVVA
ncbi:MAG: hypothetical protein ACRDP1_02465 [Nocardioidaceae bacterium]